MASKTSTSSIEYCTHSWNPCTGCEAVSDGCLNCWARELSETRLRGRAGYDRIEPFLPKVREDRFLISPYTWRDPRVVFVCNMGDIAHENIPSYVRYMAFGYAVADTRHTWLFLTKRPLRFAEEWNFFVAERGVEVEETSNIFFGVTVENHKYVNRLAWLKDMRRAQNFWISAEPLLGSFVIPDSERLKVVIAGIETGKKARACPPKSMSMLQE